MGKMVRRSWLVVVVVALVVGVCVGQDFAYGTDGDYADPWDLNRVEKGLETVAAAPSTEGDGAEGDATNFYDPFDFDATDDAHVGASVQLAGANAQAEVPGSAIADAGIAQEMDPASQPSSPYGTIDASVAQSSSVSVDLGTSIASADQVVSSPPENGFPNTAAVDPPAAEQYGFSNGPAAEQYGFSNDAPPAAEQYGFSNNVPAAEQYGFSNNPPQDVSVESSVASGEVPVDSGVSAAPFEEVSVDSGVPAAPAAPFGEVSVDSGVLAAPVGEVSVASGISAAPIGAESVGSGNVAAPIGEVSVGSGISNPLSETFRNGIQQSSCGSEPAKSFLMGFVGHSGSSAIMSTLLVHSKIEVTWPMEPMQKAKDADNASVMTKAIFDETLSKGLIPGFKLRSVHVMGNTELWSQMASEYGIRFIALTRENLFKAAIGLYTIRARFDLSAQMGLSAKEAATHCQENPDSCYYPVDNIRFFTYLMYNAKKSMDTVREMASAVKWPCVLNITYEDYLQDNDSVMQKIYNFLGVEKEENEPRFQKALPDSPCVVLTNYQEICAKLWPCEQFRPFLEDPENGCTCLDKTRLPDEELCSFEKLLAAGNLICQERDPFGNLRATACK